MTVHIEIIKNLVDHVKTTSDYKSAGEGKNPSLLTLIHDAEAVIAKSDAQPQPSNNPNTADLEKRRRQIAQNIYENFDFSYQVADDDGWAYNGMNTYTKSVYLQPEGDGDSLKATFTVRFEMHSSLPIEASCLLNGEEIGNITGGKLTDYV